MKAVRRDVVALLVLASAFTAACASSGSGTTEKGRTDLLTREEILSVEATNLYDVINRLRPRWLQVRSTRSINMETEIAVLQNEMYLGPAEVLREFSPTLAHEITYLEGARAATSIPGLMSGRHIEGAIIISTRPKG